MYESTSAIKMGSSRKGECRGRADRLKRHMTEILFTFNVSHPSRLSIV
jgi:hypothetical protein